MALTSAYLVAAGRLEEFFDTIRRAQAPETFTLSFLKDLGFTSSNERLYIPVLKGLGFLDEAGTPTDRYFAFLDDSRWQIVLAEGIREAYEDLFRLNRQAQTMSREEVTGRLRTLTRGQYSDAVIGNMARTFEAVCALANFDESGTVDEELPTGTVMQELDDSEVESECSSNPDAGEKVPRPAVSDDSALFGSTALSYRIEIVLPSTRDKSVYDAIFKSLKEHLYV